MRLPTTLALLTLLALHPVAAQEAQQAPQRTARPPSSVDYPAFTELTAEVGRYRSERMLGLSAFRDKAREPGVVILDTRSRAAYERKHLAGAVHLNFSDFTADKLAQVIPSKRSTVLIYCNNNLTGDRRNFAAKAPPLALNIPTFINLYGYGYKNVYELESLAPVTDADLEFEGTDVERRPRAKRKGK